MNHFDLKLKSGFHIVGDTKRSQAASIVLSARESTGGPDNKHDSSDQWLYVISGKGKAIVQGNERALKAGALLLIEAGETHEIINTGEQPLETLNFYGPPAY